jgi:Zn finger protein HypA/HybF involved in hydrogenase expression
MPIIIETKLLFLTRCGYLRKTEQGLWTTGSVFPQFEEDKGAFIEGVPVGLGHITSISGEVLDHTLEYVSMAMLINNMKMSDEIVEEYPTVFCHDCRCPFPDTGFDIEFNYNRCTLCGSTQFTTPVNSEIMPQVGLTCHKSHRQYNLKRIDLKIQKIGSRFAYRFVGIRAIISSARSKLLQLYKSVARLPSGGDALAGACFFAAVHEFRISRFGRGDSPATLETITLFASNSENHSKKFGTTNKVTSKRILTLVQMLIKKGLCNDHIPELKRMLLFSSRISKKIVLNGNSVIRLKDSGCCGIFISGVKRGDDSGFIVGDYIEKCNGLNIAATMSLSAIMKTIQKNKDNNKLVTLTIRRKSSRKRKRSK